MKKRFTAKDLKALIAQAKYEEELDRAFAEVLDRKKCIPYCLNGNYR